MVIGVAAWFRYVFGLAVLVLNSEETLFQQRPSDRCRRRMPTTASR